MIDILYNRLDAEVARATRPVLQQRIITQQERYLSEELNYTVKTYENGEIVSAKEYLRRIR